MEYWILREDISNSFPLQDVALLLSEAEDVDETIETRLIEINSMVKPKVDTINYYEKLDEELKEKIMVCYSLGAFIYLMCSSIPINIIIYLRVFQLSVTY